MSNFEFLKKNNGSLFNIIAEAEKLFRDEYFEQSIVQVRRFAENLCKDILADKVLPDDTFDSMICKIKDNSFGNTRMQEFADDLYFLKKQGNTSAHSSTSNQDGKIALECLERAYEISVMYSNVKFGYDEKLDKSVFSEELLMTGKQTGKKSSPIPLKEKYTEELKKNRAETKTKKNKSKQQSSISPIKYNGENSNKTLIFLALIVCALFSILYFTGISLKGAKQPSHKIQKYSVAPHQIGHKKANKI
jgi:hypothetical protein